MAGFDLNPDFTVFETKHFKPPRTAGIRGEKALELSPA